MDQNGRAGWSCRCRRDKPPPAPSLCHSSISLSPPSTPCSLSSQSRCSHLHHRQHSKCPHRPPPPCSMRPPPPRSLHPPPLSAPHPHIHIALDLNLAVSAAKGDDTDSSRKSNDLTMKHQQNWFGQMVVLSRRPMLVTTELVDAINEAVSFKPINLRRAPEDDL